MAVELSAWRETRPMNRTDAKLRKHGYSIAHRRGNEEPEWYPPRGEDSLAQPQPILQSLAIERVAAKESEKAETKGNE
jgi:hypothetical protein